MFCMDMFSAIAEPTRRDILEMLVSQGELPASAIYDKFDVSHPAISQHLKVLRDAELVIVEKHAQQRLYQINPKRLFELDSWIHRMKQQWEQRFDVLDKVLEKEKKKLLQKKRSR